MQHGSTLPLVVRPRAGGGPHTTPLAGSSLQLEQPAAVGAVEVADQGPQPLRHPRVRCVPLIAGRREPDVGEPNGMSHRYPTTSVAWALTLLTIMATSPNSSPPAHDLQLDWKENRLALLSPQLPGGKVEVWYLEAFCRRGSTERKWEETVLPQQTTRLEGPGPAARIRL